MIIEKKHLTGSRNLDNVDFCIIGSGAAGGVLAFYLSRAGKKVVVLEKGAYWPPEELGMREVALSTRLLAADTFKPTSGQYSRVNILHGECYGGGTVSSESVTWDFPRVIQEDWAKLGLTSYSPDNPKLEEYRLELRRLLEVQPVADEHHNPNNQLLKIACQREGIEWASVDRPCSFCMRCGFCTQGCRYGLKNDSANTFLKWANQKGADVYTGAEVTRIRVNYPEAGDWPWSEKLRPANPARKAEIERQLQTRQAPHQGHKFTVEARMTDRKQRLPRGVEPEALSLTVKARRVIVSAGAIASPRILLRSGLNTNGRVGKDFTLHSGAFTLARFQDSVIDCNEGINDTVECTHYMDFHRDRPYFEPERHGFFIEAAGSLPWGIANLLPGSGTQHLALMKDYRQIGGMEVTVKGDGVGQVTEDAILYDISDHDNERLIFGSQLVAKLFFRVGAIECYPSFPGMVLRSPEDIKLIENRQGRRRLGFKNKQSHLHSGHAFGGCIMGRDRKSSVVDERGEMHDLKGLFVCDGSSFPTTVGVNNCLSIMFVARKTADHILGLA